MNYYLILCRSLTYAQRSEAALDRAGIRARALRCPGGISAEGCGYCVRIPTQTLARAIEALRRASLEPKRIFAPDGDGGYEEVEWL